MLPEALPAEARARDGLFASNIEGFWPVLARSRGNWTLYYSGSAMKHLNVSIAALVAPPVADAQFAGENLSEVGASTPGCYGVQGV